MPNPLNAEGRMVVLPYWSDWGSMNPHVLGAQSRFVWRIISFSIAANVAWKSGFCN